MLHQRGDHSEAWDLLQAIPVAARDARWAAIAPQVAGSAQYAPHFQSLPTAHFSLRYIDKDVILAHYAATVLEAAYAQIGADLGYPAVVGPAAKPIVVEIYPDARGLAQATGLTVKEIDTSGTIAVCKFHRLMVTSPLATADGYGWADTLHTSSSTWSFRRSATIGCRSGYTKGLPSILNHAGAAQRAPP